MGSVVLLAGGHELAVVSDADEARDALDPSKADGAGLIALETDTGVAHVRAEHVVGIRPLDPMTAPADPQ